MTIYFWFIPVFLVLALGVLIFYFVITRGLPKTSDRSVSDALAEDEVEPPKPAAKTESSG